MNSICSNGLSMETDKTPQMLEGCILGFLSQSNLRKSRAAKVVRLYVFYYWLVVYLPLLSAIMIICNSTELLQNIVIPGLIVEDIVWKDLAMVKDIRVLNTVCSLSIGCLVMSWILDIVCQIIKEDGGVYHVAWREIICNS